MTSKFPFSRVWLTRPYKIVHPSFTEDLKCTPANEGSQEHPDFGFLLTAQKQNRVVAQVQNPEDAHLFAGASRVYHALDQVLRLIPAEALDYTASNGKTLRDAFHEGWKALAAAREPTE